MPDVALLLLGTPSVVTADGAPVHALSGSKCLALLAYLTLEPGAHSREELAALLWGETPEGGARASLRQTLARLRAGLGPAVHIDHLLVELVAPPPCDVTDFLAAVASDPAAVARFQMPRFFHGFSVRHAPAFEEWASAMRQSILRRYQQALAASARQAMGLWRWREAAEWAERWLAADPLSDEATRLAVEAHYLSGDRGMALARSTEHAERLRRETGCAPGAALRALVRRIETDAGPAAPRPVSDEWYARAPRFEASLIGRDAEWRAVLRAWKAAKRGGCEILLIEGDAGAGKSRLAEEFHRWVVADGGTVLGGRAYDARAGVPYGPIVDVVRDALDVPGIAGTAPEWLAEVARLLPDLRQRFPHLAAPAPAPATSRSDGWRLFEAVAQLLLAITAERPLAITIDDLQWCDGDSCTLLHFLTRRLARAPVLWLGTLTLGELERDAPAARLCRVLRARLHAGVVSLPPLDEDQVWQLVREMGHISTPTGARRFANWIHGVTAGNPLYIVELLKTLFAQGLLAVDEVTGEWAVQAAAFEHGHVAPMSRTVHDTIADRIERLPDQLREVLITIAVAGIGCGAELLSHVHGVSRLHAAAIGDALVERRLLVEEHARYRCDHPVIARVVRDGLTAPRIREVHRAIALALERIARGGEATAMAGEIAHHADRGGEPALAYRHALAAHEAALQHFAFAEALSWLDLAATAARSSAEGATVNRLTADVLEAAGWTEAPPLRPRALLAQEIAQEDLDLPVHR